MTAAMDWCLVFKCNIYETVRVSFGAASFATHAAKNTVRAQAKNQQPVTGSLPGTMHEVRFGKQAGFPIKAVGL